MSLMPAIGALKPIPAGSPISVVGNTSGHTTSSSTTIALPAGCAAGDYAVIAISRFTSCTITPPAGSTGLLTNFATYSTTSVADVYGYTLTSTDITNGYVSFSASSTANLYTLIVLHGVNASPVDVTGVAALASPNNAPSITCPANSVTTTASNDLVLAFGLVYLANSTTVTWGAPSGWTAQATGTLSYSFQIAVYSLAQPTAGATANAPIGATASVNTRGAGVQIAFKP